MNATLQSLIEDAVIQRGTTSGRALAKAARDHGFKISFTPINELRAGTYKYDPSDETIRAIAWLAGVPDSVAFTAAGKPVPGPPFADELPPGVDGLSPRSRKAALSVLTALVHAEQGVASEQPDTTDSTAPAGAQGKADEGEKSRDELDAKRRQAHSAPDWDEVAADRENPHKPETFGNES